MKDSRYINVKHISLYVNDISLFRATFKLKDVSDNIKEIQIVHISKDLCLIPEETTQKYLIRNGGELVSLFSDDDIMLHMRQFNEPLIKWNSGVKRKKVTTKSIDSKIIITYEILICTDIYKRADLKVIQIVLDFGLLKKYYEPQ